MASGNAGFVNKICDFDLALSQPGLRQAHAWALGVAVADCGAPSLLEKKRLYVLIIEDCLETLTLRLAKRVFKLPPQSMHPEKPNLSRALWALMQSHELGIHLVLPITNSMESNDNL